MHSEDLVRDAAYLAQSNGQGHLVRHIGELDKTAAERYAGEILKIDFKELKKMFDLTAGVSVYKDMDTDHRPAPVTVAEDFSDSEKMSLTDLGMNLIKDGKVAALTMAGGQGTRLGFDGPKGSYILGNKLNKSFFEIQAEGLLELSVKSGKTIPWYIMTGYDNHDATVSFFDSNAFFGYGSENVAFFSQGALPVMDQTGRILMKDRNSIAYAPDGNGGLFRSMASSGILDDMKRKGVKWLFTAIIDNILIKMADPLFLGFSERSGSGAASKSVLKVNPEERAGVFALTNDKPTVIEYSEISDELKNLTDSAGRLVYADANIVNHYLRIDFIEMIARIGLPYHIAFKPTSYLDDRGVFVKPDKPNSFKFEMFIFDSFRFSDGMALLRVKREEEFAPVKNKNGEDSPKTAMDLYFSYKSKEKS